jgi:single-strand DNA-binding protein
MNAINIAGRVGKAAESRQVGDTTATSFSVATDKRGKGGEKETLWFDCTIWGDRGKAVGPYITKGTTVAVSGEVGVRQYEANGESRVSLTVRVSELTLLGGGEKADGGQQRQGAAKPAARAAVSSPLGADDEIPFAPYARRSIV